jgi:hypothetical protein
MSGMPPPSVIQAGEPYVRGLEIFEGIRIGYEISTSRENAF